jgi:hypothetical protein
MTASTANGTEIALEVLNPSTLVGHKLSGRSQTIVRHAAVATTSIDEINDVVLFARVPMHAKIRGIWVKCDDLDSHSTPTLAVDVGLFYAGDSVGQSVTLSKVIGDVIDADAFASAITTLQAAVLTWTEITNESGVTGIEDYDKEVWELGALTSDPGGHAIIGFKVTAAAATAVAGDVLIKVEYEA